MTENKTQEQQVEIQQQKQKELLNELKGTGFKIEDTDEFKGIIGNLQKERQSKQEIEEQLAELRDQNAALSNQISKLADRGDEDPLKGKDPDDYLSVKEAKKLLDSTLKQVESREKQQKQADLYKRFADSEQKAVKEYTAEKMGEGLDYKSVLEGYKRVIRRNPKYQEVMINADEPALEAYRIGLLDPEIQERVEAAKSAKVLDKMKNSGRVPKGAGSLKDDGPIIDDDYEALLNKSDTELMRTLEMLENK